MSIHKNAVIAFRQILENSSNLLTNENWKELHQLSSELPEDDEDIVEKIEDWLKSHPSLLAVYQENLQSMDLSLTKDGNLGPSNSHSPTEANQQSESSQKLTQNAIKLNSTVSDDKKSQPKP